LNFAVRKKWLPASPMTAVDLRAMSADAPLDELTFLEPGEVAGLVEAAVEGEYHALDVALYMMATHTGLRQGELRGLRWASVDFGHPRSASSRASRAGGARARRVGVADRAPCAPSGGGPLGAACGVPLDGPG
jgi:integrase